MTFHSSPSFTPPPLTAPHHIVLKKCTGGPAKTLAKKMGKERKEKILPGGRKQRKEKSLSFLQGRWRKGGVFHEKFS